MSRHGPLGEGEQDVFEADDGSRICVMHRNGRLEVHCHGAPDHYHDDGGCEHTDLLLSKGDNRSAMTVLGFCAWGSREALLDAVNADSERAGEGA